MTAVSAELLAVVERSPAATAVHDRTAWVGLFTGRRPRRRPVRFPSTRRDASRSAGSTTRSSRRGSSSFTATSTWWRCDGGARSDARGHHGPRRDSERADASALRPARVRRRVGGRAALRALGIAGDGGPDAAPWRQVAAAFHPAGQGADTQSRTQRHSGIRRRLPASQAVGRSAARRHSSTRSRPAIRWQRGARLRQGAAVSLGERHTDHGSASLSIDYAAAAGPHRSLQAIRSVLRSPHRRAAASSSAKYIARRPESPGSGTSLPASADHPAAPPRAGVVLETLTE